MDTAAPSGAGAEPGGVAMTTSGSLVRWGAMASLGVVAGVSSAAVALLGQARITTRAIEKAALEAALADGTLVPPALPGATRAQQERADDLVHVRLPQGDGVYRIDGQRTDDDRDVGAVTLVMLGDSTSVGYGTRTVDELPGVILARDVSAGLGRPVRLVSLGRNGARTTDLARQQQACLALEPDVVVILIGANDLRDTVPPSRSAALLGGTTAVLTALGIPVVVGTCPDFGVITAIPQPLRSVLGAWSLRLAALQERAVTRAGGVSVALARLVSPQFLGHPEMFASDHFHPSGAGYGRAMAALLPAVVQALGGSAGDVRDRAGTPGGIEEPATDDSIPSLSA